MNKKNIKKNFFTLILVSMVSFSNLTVFAEGTSSVISIEKDENGTTIVEYSGSDEEDDESEETDTSDEVDESEVDLSTRNPISIEDMTEEEIEALEEEGYIVSDDGYAYPSEYGGEVSGTQSVGSISDADVNVTFHVTIDETISVPIILEFCDMSTYIEYYVELYASEEYTTKVKLPAGVYYFTWGGPEDDYYSIYSVQSPEYFTVYDDQENYVSVVLAAKGSVLGFSDDEDEDEETEEESSETYQIETKTETGTNRVFYIIFGIVMISIGAVICFVFYKYQTTKDDKNKKHKNNSDKK